MLRAGVGEDVRLEDLAREAQLSPYHFCRAFKQSTGLSPYSFLRRLRIEAAKEMLESSHATVTEVALSVGYEAAPAFNRVFHA
jgi:AraC family transcriptional regulator